MNKPLVSIIILNYNGKKWLEGLLPTVRKIKYKPLEVIVVNNGSSDDSAKLLMEKFPEVRVLEIKKNIGFAGGNNRGVKFAKGKYILVLNNDTKTTPNLLNPLVDIMEKNPDIGVVQPKMLSMRDHKFLDCVASFYTSTGFLYHYGYMQEAKKKKYNKVLSCYSIKGACMFLRREDYLNLGGFDEDFVCYVEETDLCHRFLLSGKKIIYCPDSFIYHWGGGDMSIMEKSETTAFRSFRNRFYSYFKNLSPWELIKILPINLVLSEIYIVKTLFSNKYKNAVAAQLGTLWWVFHLPEILRKRKFVQTKIRKVKDSDFLSQVKRDPALSYYIHFFTNPEGKYNEKAIN